MPSSETTQALIGGTGMDGTLTINGPLSELSRIAADIGARYPSGVSAGVSIPSVAIVYVLAAFVQSLAVRLFQYGAIEYSRKVNVRDVRLRKYAR